LKVVKANQAVFQKLFCGVFGQREPFPPVYGHDPKNTKEGYRSQEFYIYKREEEEEEEGEREEYQHFTTQNRLA
jgi:hypothetical protein